MRRHYVGAERDQVYGPGNAAFGQETRKKVREVEGAADLGGDGKVKKEKGKCIKRLLDLFDC